MNGLILGKKKVATHNIKVKDIRYIEYPEYKEKNAAWSEADRVRKPQIMRVLVTNTSTLSYTITSWKSVCDRVVSVLGRTILPAV